MHNQHQHQHHHHHHNITQPSPNTSTTTMKPPHPSPLSTSNPHDSDPSTQIQSKIFSDESSNRRLTFNTTRSSNLTSSTQSSYRFKLVDESLNTSHNSPPPPETPTRFDNLDDTPSSPTFNDGAMVPAVERYYSPFTSPQSMTTPPRDDFPPPKLSCLHSHMITFNQPEKPPSPPPAPAPAPPPPPQPKPKPKPGIEPTNKAQPHHVHFASLPQTPSSSTLHDHQHTSNFNWSEGSPEAMVDPPPRRGIIYGGGGGVKKINIKKIGLGKPWKKVDKVKKVWLGLGMRVVEIVLCLISFSVMGSDKTQGWSGDSFDRYKEYRFCFTVNIVGFAYAGFQALKLVYVLVGGKQIVGRHICSIFDFIVDQVLAYLLISASTASAARVTDWQANWGKDEFTNKAGLSVSMAFLAFIAFALSSLISGYNIFNC